MNGLPVSQRTVRRARAIDALAAHTITVGGIAVIGSVVLILYLIVSETFPLFRSGEVTPVATARLPELATEQSICGIGIQMSADERQITGVVLTADGSVHLLDLREERVLKQPDRIEPPAGASRVVFAEPVGENEFSLQWDDGTASLARVSLDLRFSEQGLRYIEHAVTVRAFAPRPSGGRPVQSLVRLMDGVMTRVALLESGSLDIYRRIETENILTGVSETSEASTAVDRPPEVGAITAMTLTAGGSRIYAGTDRGYLLYWGLDDEGSVQEREVIRAFVDGRRITALAMVFGDVSVAVGDERGGLSTWFRVRHALERSEGGESVWRTERVHDLHPHRSAVVRICASRRDKSLLSLDADGIAHLDHMTSERHLLQVAGPLPLRLLSLSPRGNSMIGVDEEGEIRAWRVKSPHPETSFGTLFGQVHYEGYNAPTYTWQTTGSEDFEAKTSLVPLIFGTLKGTVYAMLFSVPLALFAAVYVSKFTSHEFRSWIKPTVEIMAAVPSVVIGFLIALWLAPVIQHWILAVFLAAVTIPGAFVVFMLLWSVFRRHDFAKRIERGYEFLPQVMVIGAGVLLAVLLAPWVETTFFQMPAGDGTVGDFKLWLFSSLGMRYDQRNAIIIAFGLGFAVIPIIFSIAEDSLTNVPRALTAASLALGASRWQTVWRVVLPSASPGIFAGIMIGFGRAVGETMIVLMATGNTPIIDWSPFNGLRTLSANIAVEIPEAPKDETLYRTLFLCAVLLFCLTFVLNTAAEVIRDRLRRRYGRF